MYNIYSEDVNLNWWFSIGLNGHLFQNTDFFGMRNTASLLSVLIVKIHFGLKRLSFSRICLKTILQVIEV